MAGGVSPSFSRRFRGGPRPHSSSTTASTRLQLSCTPLMAPSNEDQNVLSSRGPTGVLELSGLATCVITISCIQCRINQSINQSINHTATANKESTNRSTDSRAAQEVGGGLNQGSCVGWAHDSLTFLDLELLDLLIFVSHCLFVCIVEDVGQCLSECER